MGFLVAKLAIKSHQNIKNYVLSTKYFRPANACLFDAYKQPNAFSEYDTAVLFKNYIKIHTKMKFCLVFLRNDHHDVFCLKRSCEYRTMVTW